MVFDFDFPSPERRLDISPTSGGLGEHCLSSAVRHVLCASPGRVAQPRLLAKYRGNPEGAANRGRLLWVTFLGKTRKVTSCRATPDGVGVEFENQRASPILRYGCAYSGRTVSGIHSKHAALRRPFDKLRANGHRNSWFDKFTTYHTKINPHSETKPQQTAPSSAPQHKPAPPLQGWIGIPPSHPPENAHPD
jgi:hypothetical protein